MRSSSFIKVVLIAMGIGCSVGAHAQFGLSNLLGKISGGGGSSAGNPVDIVKNARNAMASFVKAKLGLIEAMGGSEELAAQKQILESLKKGDAAATKEDLETFVSLDKATSAMIAEKAAENTQLDAKNKEVASKSMIEYVGGVVSAKKLIGSVTSLANNPTSILSSLDAITYLMQNLPSIVSGGASTTSTLFTYLGANGVDVSEAKKAAADLGV